MNPTSSTPGKADPTPSSPPTFAPSQTVNPRSSQRFLQSQEASPASRLADSPPVLRRQCITTDSEIGRQGLESPGFLLPRAPNPNAAPPVLYSFFPLSPNDMDPTSPTPDTANPTRSCSPTFAPSQTVNPRSSQRFLQSQEASPASQPADSPPILRRQCITTDSKIGRQELEALAKLIEETKRAEAARISHPGLQICNPQAQVAKKIPKSDARKITKSAPSRIGKATSYKSKPSDLFTVAKALGGNRLLDLVCTAYASYVLKVETEARREPSDQSNVDQN